MAEQVVDARPTEVEGPLSRVFPLDAARSSSIVAAIALLFVIPWALLSASGALYLLPKVLTSSTALIGEIVLVGLTAGIGWLIVRIYQEAFPGRAYLALTPRGVVLRHPLLLRRRLEIPFNQIDRVSVSSSTSPGFWEPHDFALEKEERGLSWVASEHETVDALDATSRFLLPLASHVQSDEPNVAVVLRDPIDLTKIRHKPISSGDLAVRRLCDVEHAPGFFCRVQDADAAAIAFSERGLLGKLDGERAALLEPSASDLKRFKWWRARVVFGQIASIVVLVRFVYWFYDFVIGR